MRFQQHSLSVPKAVLCAVTLLIMPASLHAEDTAQTTATSCLWSVTSQQNTVYLLGSVHVLKEENYPLQENIDQAFASAPHLVFEVNLDEMSSPLTQLGSLTKGMYTNGQTLKGTLSPESYTLVETKLSHRGYGMTLFQLMKPWMLATTVTILELQKLGFETTQGVDQHLYQRAKLRGKTVEGFETVDYQLSLFDNLSPKTQEQFLLQTLGELDIIEQETNHLVESWIHGRIEGLEIMLENMKDFPDLYEALITQRNKNWLPQVESYLQKDEPYMIVVGTLHLLGEEGLLTMLKEKGYAVNQL